MSKITKEELYNLKEEYTTMQIFSLIRKNKDYEDFLVEYYKDISTELAEMVYLFYNNMDKPKCEICDTYVNWQGKDRYKPTCSIECGITLKKQKIKVARLHERVMNQRTDFLNKLSTDIIKNHDVICIEDLNTKGMLRNHKLAKSISDVSWSAFMSKLEYKAEWYGKTIVKVSRWFPSTQICSDCGHQDGKKSLEIRSWTCPVCHEHHDRDINASKNILAEGLRTLALA